MKKSYEYLEIENQLLKGLLRSYASQNDDTVSELCLGGDEYTETVNSLQEDLEALARRVENKLKQRINEFK